jgi:hypothetical protein
MCELEGGVSPKLPYFLFPVSLTKLTLESENVRGGEKHEQKSLDADYSGIGGTANVIHCSGLTSMDVTQAKICDLRLKNKS